MNHLLNESYIKDIKQGYLETENSYQCIICGKEFIKGEIFQQDNHYYDAKKMVEIHIQEVHHSMLDYLLSLSPDYLGISETQKIILKAMAEKKTDKEIADEMGLSASTIRNHRFKFREKERQARLYLSILALIGESSDTPTSFVDAHPTATQIDDRYNLTEKEKEKVLATYMTKEGAIKELPSKEKRKLVILRKVTENFKKEKQYSEVEINRILKRIYADYPYLRRLLIEYGFLERTKDGRLYWLR